MPRCIYLRIGKESKVPSSAPRVGKRWGWRGWTEAIIWSVRQEMIQFVASNRRSICGNSETSNFLETGMDVTDHELLARELRRRESYLPRHKGSARQGSFGWRVSSGEIFWSDETFRIFEFAPSSKVSLHMILERVHPQDMPSVEMAMAAASRAEGIDLEHRLVMPDGESNIYTL